MKLQRDQVRLKKLTDEDDDYVNASPAERRNLMWELTAEVWSLKKPSSAEQPLQRDRVKLLRRGDSPRKKCLDQ